MSIQRGELKVLIDLLERDPTGVNACDEVRVHIYPTLQVSICALQSSGNSV